MWCFVSAMLAHPYLYSQSLPKTHRQPQRWKNLHLAQASEDHVDFWVQEARVVPTCCLSYSFGIKAPIQFVNETKCLGGLSRGFLLLQQCLAAQQQVCKPDGVLGSETVCSHHSSLTVQYNKGLWFAGEKNQGTLSSMPLKVAWPDLHVRVITWECS